MGNNIPIQTLENFSKSKKLTLEEFKEQLPRKMTIHLLSSKIEDCINFIDLFTKEKMENKTELLEENIKNKINLYSFMNYKAYDDPSKLMEEIVKKAKNAFEEPDSIYFSEVLIILDNNSNNNNDNIKKQVEIIKDKFNQNDNIKYNSYLNPFLILISPKVVDLDGFLKNKRIQYKITFENISSFIKKKEKEKENENENKKEKENENKNKNKNENKSENENKNENDEEKENENEKEVLKFIRKLNILFCYFNELGDEFSFKNSKDKEIIINNEDDLNNTTFVNILLLGPTGAGKSTLINLLLEEMKSIEGGNGNSTTSKKIIVYKKRDFPIRFYDVKGIDDSETVKNYKEIMKDFNDNNSISHDSINIIFYCKEYKNNGTIFFEQEKALFKELTEFDIPIIFIINKSPKDFANEKGNNEIENIKKRYENNINNSIKKSFQNNETENDEQKKERLKKFLDKTKTNFFFVNLVKNKENPIFGIDKVLSYLSKLVSEKDWNDLETACKENKEQECKDLLKKNIFLRYYTDLNKLDQENQQKAKLYLKSLKAGAFFSGIVPGLDVGMEYYYRYLFIQKLKKLYGYDENEAKEATKKNSINEKPEIQDQDGKNKDSINDSEENNNSNSDKEVRKLKDQADKSKNLNTKKKEEKKIESKINTTIDNSAKNFGSFLRVISEAGGAAIKIIPETGSIAARVTINSGVKVVSWALLPITCIGFGAWSVVKVDKDCTEMINIFHEAFISQKLKTLLQYVKSIRKAVKHLDDLSKRIIEGSQEEKKNE